MWILIALAGCSTVHTGSMSVAAENARQAEAAQRLRATCAPLPAERREVCNELGLPTAPERATWATAAWWYYETRGLGTYDGNLRHVAVILCSRYVAFADDAKVTRSDEQCREIKRFVDE